MSEDLVYFVEDDYLHEEDAISEMQSSNEIDTKVSKINIVKNTRDYDLPADLISVKTISVKDTDDDGKYKQIRRLAAEPLITEDTNP